MANKDRAQYGESVDAKLFPADGLKLDLPSLKLTVSHPKMDGWNTTVLLGRPIFRGYVSFREAICIKKFDTPTSQVSHKKP